MARALGRVSLGRVSAAAVLAGAVLAAAPAAAMIGDSLVDRAYPQPLPAARPLPAMSRTPSPLPVAAPARVPGDSLLADRRLPAVPAQLADPFRSALAFEVTLAAADPKDRAAAGLRAFYAARGFAPVWTADGRATVRTAGGLDRLARAGEDGLDPSRYAIPRPTARGTAAAVEAELAVARAFSLYAREASSGRTQPRDVWSLVTLKPAVPDTGDVLADLAAHRDLVAALDAYNPPHEGYRRLKRALARLVAERTADPEPVPAGNALKLGMRDARVEVIRRRLGVAASADPTLYDADVRSAVQDYQAAAGLTADGILGAMTVRVLNGARKQQRLELLLANMERWRWMPRDLGREHVFVDIPAFELAIVRDGVPQFRTRVVVGTPTTPTPVFSDEIQFIVVNPFWNVPVSIASKEMLPSIRSNPDGYFARSNYEVVVDGRVVPPSTVAWNESTIRRVRIRQRPGNSNALGNLKFMFPNEHSVYLHDTPSKALFDRSGRAFSHGCVRVENPFAFADALLEGTPKWNGERLRKMIGGREARIDLATPVPVHLAYFTAVARDDGSLTLRDDPYGLDARTVRALGL